MAELDNWIYDACLEKIIIEILYKSHQPPQEILNTTFQSRINYKQPLQIPIMFLFSGVVTNQRLKTYYLYNIHVTPFYCKGGRIRVKVESVNVYGVVGVKSTVDLNIFYN